MNFPIFAAAAIGLMIATAPRPAPAAAQVGDQHVSYIFAATGQPMPYRLFVPSTYTPSKAYPLVVVLHGAGGDENAAFHGNDLEKLAESRGVILLAPLGYSRFGGYGDIYPVVVTHATAEAGKSFHAATAAPPPRPAGPPPPQPAAAPDDYAEQPAGQLIDPAAGVLSEAETLAALADVRSHYTIDPRRIYLMGNSMGGVGTAYLAAKYPEIWAAVSPSGGPIAAWSYPYWRLRDAKLPALFVHGALDAHSNAKWSALLVQRAKADGADAQLIVVPGGTHGGAWTMVLPQIFDFFAAHQKPAGT
jgi:poly(3-hydroxybutyrate) depolymerase